MMRTDRYAERLLVLPAVLDADLTTTLPDLITVRLVERVPVVIWNVGGHRFLVDRTGLAFAPAILGGGGAVASGGAAASAGTSPKASSGHGSAKASLRPAALLHAASPGTSTGSAVPSAPAAPTASAAQTGDPADRNPADGLPIVTDRRTASAGLDVGGHIDPVDLDAATRLAGVRPADIGSGAAELRVSIEDGDGYVLRPVGVPWVARFGLFTPSIRTPDMIPGQVRLLHSFLAGREMTVKSVTLADDRSGTWVSR
jgi:hypothetical protein